MDPRQCLVHLKILFQIPEPWNRLFCSIYCQSDSGGSLFQKAADATSTCLCLTPTVTSPIFSYKSGALLGLKKNGGGGTLGGRVTRLKIRPKMRYMKLMIQLISMQKLNMQILHCKIHF